MKLPQEVQKAASEDTPREDGEFEALPDGYYRAEIEKIDLSERPGASGFHQWVVVWRIKAPRAFAKRTQWDRLSLSPKAAWKMRELFDALGYEYDSDSDELIGETAILELFQEEITTGKRKGEMGNSVAAVLEDNEENRKLVGK
jgi:hypothetical protein